MEYYNDIKFTAIGRQESKFYHIDYHPEYYGIAFTRRGRMRFKKDNRQERVLEAPFVYWYTPESCYTHGCFSGETRDHSWCFCVGERIKKITASVLEKMIPEGYQEILNPIETARLYDSMIHLSKNNNPSDHFHLVVIFERIVAQVLESYFASREIREPEFCQKIRNVAETIKENPFAEWDFQYIAEKKIFVSYSYFRQLFSRIMNIPPTEYLLRCRMESAGKMLSEKHVQIQEVASRCGYDNAASFSRSFKKRIGLSPSDYIAHLQR